MSTDHAESDVFEKVREELVVGILVGELERDAPEARKKEVCDKYAAPKAPRHLDAGTEHIGSMAGAFNETFGLGHAEDDEVNGITTADRDGVAPASLQTLADRCDEQQDQLAALREDNNALQKENAELKAENEALRERVERVEGALEIETPPVDTED